MKVTCFKNIWDTVDPMFVDVLEILKRIKDGNSKEIIQKIRETKNGEEYNQLKKRLPSVCFSGRFSKRESSALLEHSGLICLDVDEIKPEDLDKIKSIIELSKYTFSCFISPGGHGFKLLVKISASPAYHKPHYLALEKYFNQKFAVFKSSKKNEKEYKGKKSKIDPNQGDYLRVCLDKSGKDVNRVCYESWDENIFYNEDSEEFTDIIDHVEYQKEVDDYDVIIKKLQTWIDRKDSYYKTNRNQFLYKFSSALCRYGVDEMRTMTYLNSNYGDYPLNELTTTVKGAYKANDFKSEEFTELEKKQRFTNVNIDSKKSVTAFWAINDKGRVRIDSKQFLRFIEANGFGIYRHNKGDAKWHFVKITNMIVDIVTVLDIKKEILSYVEKHAPEPVFDELQNKNRYFENTYLNALPIIDVEQIRDSPDSSFIFFENFYYQIDVNGAKRHTYIDLKGRHIWRSQICKKNIEQIRDYKDFDYFKFIKNALGNDQNAIRSALTSLGYCIHTYKKKRLAKLVYTCDQSDAELDGLPSGGTGKNLFLECLKFVRSVIDVDGKTFDKKDKFNLQVISDDTQIISIDDYEGDIKELFTKITGHLEYEKKGQDKVILSFEEAPKIVVSSNNTPKGFSDSFSRRLHQINFTDHYNAHHTPSDEFGPKDFFSDDWTQVEYDMLYSLLFDCVKSYFQNGLVKVVDNEKEKYKHAVKNMGHEFANYFIKYEFSEHENGRNLHATYLKESGDDMKMAAFYSNIRKLANLMVWKFEDIGRGEERKIKIIKPTD